MRGRAKENKGSRPWPQNVSLRLCVYYYYWPLTVFRTQRAVSIIFYIHIRFNVDNSNSSLFNSRQKCIFVMSLWTTLFWECSDLTSWNIIRYEFKIILDEDSRDLSTISNIARRVKCGWLSLTCFWLERERGGAWIEYPCGEVCWETTSNPDKETMMRESCGLGTEVFIIEAEWNWFSRMGRWAWRGLDIPEEECFDRAGSGC